LHEQKKRKEKLEYKPASTEKEHKNNKDAGSGHDICSVPMDHPMKFIYINFIFPTPSLVIFDHCMSRHLLQSRFSGDNSNKDLLEYIICRTNFRGILRQLAGVCLLLRTSNPQDQHSVCST